MDGWVVIDIFGCLEALYEWAESYDTKDWDRLAKCLAPTLLVRPLVSLFFSLVIFWKKTS